MVELRLVLAVLFAGILSGCAFVPQTREDFATFYKERGEACAQYCDTGKNNGSCKYYYNGAHKSVKDVDNRSDACMYAYRYLDESPKAKLIHWQVLQCAYSRPDDVGGWGCYKARDIAWLSSEQIKGESASDMPLAVDALQARCFSNPPYHGDGDYARNCLTAASIVEKMALPNRAEVQRYFDRACSLGSEEGCKKAGASKQYAESMAAAAKERHDAQSEQYRREFEENDRRNAEISRKQWQETIQYAATGLANAANTYANRKNPGAQYSAATANGSALGNSSTDTAGASQVQQCINTQCAALTTACEKQQGQAVCYRAAACGCQCAMDAVSPSDSRYAEYARCQRENTALAEKLACPTCPRIVPAR